MYLSRSILFAVMFACSIPVDAQSGAADTKHYPESLREDLSTLVSFLKEVHPDLHRYTRASEFDSIVALVHGTLNIPLTAEDAMRQMRPIMRAIADAHTSGELPNTVDRSNEVLIPLHVQVVDDELVILRELKGFRTFKTGSIIRSINGISSSQILERTRDMISTDGNDPSLANYLIEQRFPLLFQQEFGTSREYTLEVLLPDGTEYEQTLFGLTQNEMLNAGHNAVNMPTSAHWDLELLEGGKIGWLKIPTLDVPDLEREGVRVEKALSNMLADLHDASTDVLVIDVRGAGGAELSMAELVYGHIAQAPFRVVKSISVATLNRPVHYDLTDRNASHFEDVSTRYVEQDGRFVIRPDDPILELIRPVKKPFNGVVYILQDGGTREAGAALSMMAKRDGRARLIGTPTGTNAAAFCGGRELLLKLPRTGLRYHIPLIRYQFDTGEGSLPPHGVMPDHRLAPTPEAIAAGKDAMRITLMLFIKARHE